MSACPTPTPTGAGAAGAASRPGGRAGWVTCMPPGSGVRTVQVMRFRQGAPVWVRGERARMAAIVEADRGADIEVSFVHGAQRDVVSARDVEPRDPAHPVQL